MEKCIPVSFLAKRIAIWMIGQFRSPESPIANCKVLFHSLSLSAESCVDHILTLVIIFVYVYSYLQTYIDDCWIPATFRMLDENCVVCRSLSQIHIFLLEIEHILLFLHFSIAEEFVSHSILSIVLDIVLFLRMQTMCVQ